LKSSRSRVYAGACYHKENDLRIVCDLDGVLCEWGFAFAKLLCKVTGENKLPPNYENDPTFPNQWEWPQGYGYTNEQVLDTWKVVNSSQTFWEDLEPLPGTRGVLHCLSDITKHGGHEVYFLTFRTGTMCKRQTERWLEYNGMEFPTVIVCSAKGGIMKALEIDAAIDDHLPTANAIAKYSMAKRMYLKEASYNREGREPNLLVVKCVREMLELEGVWE
jgi:hypothetical protein